MTLRNLLRKSLRWPTWGLDTAICLILVLGYCTWLLNTVNDLGYARDEGFYFQAADAYAKWFKVLFSDPAQAISQATVDRHWRVNHEHPALIKSLFALSRALLHDHLKWFDERGTSYRFVGMAFSAVAVAITYLWGKQAFSNAKLAAPRMSALVAALSFALMPRIFYHAHLNCFDMPVLSMWMICAFGYYQSVERKSLAWALTTGLLYGLLLNTKHNSWLLPFALVAHVVLSKGLHGVRELRVRRISFPPALWAMALIGPAVFFATWPWIWFNTYQRLVEYVKFHTAHVYYNIEFLGQTYFEPPFPRTYAPLMTLGTVPAVTLLLALSGIALFLIATWKSHSHPWLNRARAVGIKRSLGPCTRVGGAQRRFHNVQILWLLCILASYAPWLSNSSPIFGATKHWITAYPFLCLFAGVAFATSVRAAQRSLPKQARHYRAAELGLALSALVAPFAIALHSHPFGLSTYTPLVGGAPGGANLGLNRSFWGYTTGSVQDYITEHAAPKSRVFIHDTALQSWRMMARDRRVPRRLKAQIGVAGSQMAVYHHEQHMARVEHQIWVDYGTVRPSHIAAFDGVPIVWVYERPNNAGGRN